MKSAFAARKALIASATIREIRQMLTTTKKPST